MNKFNLVTLLRDLENLVEESKIDKIYRKTNETITYELTNEIKKSDLDIELIENDNQIKVNFILYTPDGIETSNIKTAYSFINNLK